MIYYYLKSYRLILASADPTKISWSDTSIQVTLSLHSFKVCIGSVLFYVENIKTLKLRLQSCRKSDGVFRNCERDI